MDSSVADALQGIAAGDEVIAITWLHEGRREVLQVYPGSQPGVVWRLRDALAGSA